MTIKRDIDRHALAAKRSPPSARASRWSSTNRTRTHLSSCRVQRRTPRAVSALPLRMPDGRLGKVTAFRCRNHPLRYNEIRIHVARRKTDMKLTFTVIAALGSLGLLAACGGTSAPGVAQLGSTPTPSAQAASSSGTVRLPTRSACARTECRTFRSEQPGRVQWRRPSRRFAAVPSGAASLPEPVAGRGADDGRRSCLDPAAAGAVTSLQQVHAPEWGAGLPRSVLQRARPGEREYRPQLAAVPGGDLHDLRGWIRSHNPEMARARAVWQ